MILNKRYEFARLVKEKADLPEIAIKDMSVLIEAFCDTVLEQLYAGNTVSIKGFGRFEIKKHNKTRRRIKFTAMPSVRKMFND